MVFEIEYIFSEEDRTSPIPNETLAYLCERLSIAEEEAACAGDEEFYVWSLIEPIRDTLVSDTEQALSNEFIQESLAPFEFGVCDEYYNTSFEEMVKDCTYDFVGDGRNLVRIYFGASGKVLRVNLDSDY